MGECRICKALSSGAYCRIHKKDAVREGCRSAMARLRSRRKLADMSLSIRMSDGGTLEDPPTRSLGTSNLYEKAFRGPDGRIDFEDEGRRVRNERNRLLGRPRD